MDCALLNFQHVLGQKWTWLILEEIKFSGSTHFNDIKQKIPVTNKVLAQRLTVLVGEGIIVKRTQEGKHAGFAYSLTQKGKELLEIFAQYKEWGSKYYDLPTNCKSRNCADCHSVERALCKISCELSNN